MSITENLNGILATIPHGVKLVAVSKFHPASAAKEAYDAGQRIFGESRMQEVVQKSPQLPADIEWHFIGHLQTNKVKSIVPFTHTIHSVDSWKLLQEIEKQAQLAGREINCLLEIHIAQEESKYGLTFDTCKTLLETENWRELKYAKIAGVMGMATNTDNESVIRSEFRALKEYFNQLKQSYFKEFDYFREISMGMSHDYQIAIQEGATMVRVGSLIFGNREY
ncbi:pyridoxal phosphate enzyme (YggS family) [Dysgonomonas sp. PH5-45]|uniref:YggS family pyridoxal phosphate-dependent enzyme n=1 Tax=unclassified Dysgonomonas TaxID=2630389 RepID=UPI00247527C1|nr:MULTISPECIES: YggS family pyridoxal phosphate-dependent enzyme [unclassified Dysgonomonas]MDH6353737.1 pyridoxal phosphate enzyme (YggS family) [Dysgonomonas sp. PH5-45]MDH6386640.1 pyridoxal phosphate enzyme (YggS family) [Dysgonomonas sp. PH5-37]